MVIVSGMERMTFEVLRVLRERGADVHCVLNSWENERVRPLVESIGASWSTGSNRCPLRRSWNPLYLARVLWDVSLTSAGLLADAVRFRPTHVFLPEFSSALRNAPALVLLRLLGVVVVLRMSNHPDSGRFYELLWRRVIAPLVTTFVANSRFSLERALSTGVPRDKLVLIHNSVSARPGSVREDDVRALVRSRRTLLCVGQIAPYKGTDLAVEATLELLSRGADLQLVVVGAEPTWPSERVEYFRELVRRSDETSLPPRVHFVGPRQDVLDLMSESFLLLAPIRQEETFGNVVLEAKSVGLPVVAFDRGGIGELVENGRTGILCESVDLAGLVAGIDAFLADEGLWRAARERSLASFDDAGCEYRPEVFAAKWEALLEGSAV